VYHAPKVRSRRYPVKVMYLGVVGNPNESHNFDGKIFLKRVSKVETVSRASMNQRFSVDVLVNESLQHGSWHELATTEATVEECLETVAATYDLDEFVGERLVLTYTTFAGNLNKGSKKTLDGATKLGELGFRTREDGTQVAIAVEDLEMFVSVRAGDVTEKDCSCDSSFMLETMPEVGLALRWAFHWVADDEPIYLVMDNAGGHGTNDAKEAYTEGLVSSNVEVIWQVARSPETNMLDLGVWMSIQSAVQKVHHGRRCQHDALAKSVEDAWKANLNIEAFSNVFKRLRVVLRCILDDDGGNRLVEAKRGELFRDATIIDLTEETIKTESETTDQMYEDEDDDSVSSL
jgi:hypothetical protein